MHTCLIYKLARLVMTQGASYFHSTVRPLVIITSILLSTFLVSVATGMTALIIPLSLYEYGLSSMHIGAMMALLLVVIIPLSLFIPALLKRIGARALFVISTLLRCYAILAFSQYDNIYYWAALLLMYGVGEFIFLFILQVWMGLVPFSKGTGLIFSMVGVSISIGIAISAVVVERLQAYAINPYFAMAAITTAALFPLLVSFLWTPTLTKPSLLTFKTCFSQTPLVMTAAFIIGIQTMGIQYLIVLYGMHAGLGFTQASFLLTAFTLGPIVFEVSLASLSDKFNRRNVLMAGTFLSLVCAIYLPLAIYYPYVAYGLLFLWGGIVGGLYSVSFAILCDRYDSQHMISAMGKFTAMFGAGGVVGVFSIGALMDIFDSADALPTVTNIANFLFFCFAANRFIKALSTAREETPLS